MKQKLFYFLCFSLYFISGRSVLNTIGWPVDAEGHMMVSPSFFLVVLLFSLCLINAKNFRKYEYEFWGVVLVVTVLVFNKLTGRVVPLKAAVTGFLSPIMFSTIIKSEGKRICRERIQNLFLWFLIINSLIAIVEKTTNTYLLSIGGVENLGNTLGFRSRALLGHPLSNSSATTTIMTFVLLSDLKLNKKILIWTLGFASLLCFNSRFAIVVSLLMLIVWAAKEFLQNKRQERFNVLFLFIPFAILLFAYLMFMFGFGDRLLRMGLYDDSSSAARIEIWQIFNHIDWKDLHLGISKEKQAMLMYISGTDDLIVENCWIIFMLNYGYLLMGILLFYFVFLFRHFLKSYDMWQSCFVILPWLAIISSSNSIALGGLGIMIMLILLYAFSPDCLSNYRYKRFSVKN